MVYYLKVITMSNIKKIEFPTEDMDTYRVINQGNLIKLGWSKDVHNDYYNLSCKYFKAGCRIVDEIESDYTDHDKTDRWIFAAIALLRQASELISKALVIRKYTHGRRIDKAKITKCFLENKHNIIAIFEKYCDDILIELSNQELEWLRNYLLDLESIDAKSDVFRFPFRSDFLSVFGGKNLNIGEMMAGLKQAYYILQKCYLGTSKYSFREYISPTYLNVNGGFYDCYLWQGQYGSSYYGHICGYEGAIKLLEDENNDEFFYPIMFMKRNLLELYLKRIGRMECDVNLFEARRCRLGSHEIYHDLWTKIVPGLREIEPNSGNVLDIVGRELKKIENVDRSGDMYRYPTDYGLNYRNVNMVVDIDNTYACFRQITSFLDCCEMALEEYKDYYYEMLSEISN